MSIIVQKKGGVFLTNTVAYCNFQAALIWSYYQRTANVSHGSAKTSKELCNWRCICHKTKKKKKLQKIKKNQVGLNPLPISTRWPDVPVYLDSPHFEPCVPADQQLCCFVLVPGVPFISICFFFPFIKSTLHVVAHHKGVCTFESKVFGPCTGHVNHTNESFLNSENLINLY